VGGLVVGLLVDDATGSSPTWTLVGIGVGVLLGIVAFVLRVRAALRE
jgi:LPXTG-motif cell wall-anchored protein